MPVNAREVLSTPPAGDAPQREALDGEGRSGPNDGISWVLSDGRCRCVKGSTFSKVSRWMWPLCDQFLHHQVFTTMRAVDLTSVLGKGLFGPGT